MTSSKLAVLSPLPEPSPAITSDAAAKPKPKPKPKPKQRRKSNRASPRVPRKGTLAAFVCSLPFDMPSDEVVRRAKDAGLSYANVKNVSKARCDYPNLRKRFRKGEGLRATQEALEPRKRPRRPQPPTIYVKPPPPPTDWRNTDADTTAASRDTMAAFTALVLRLGIDAARAAIAELEQLASNKNRNKSNS